MGEQERREGCSASGCLSLIMLLVLMPILFYYIPLPEKRIKVYPVYGNSSFEVLNHKIIISLGAFEQYDQSQYGMKRHFKVWMDVPNELEGKTLDVLECRKLEYRIDGDKWREADRASEGGNKGATQIWYWSPLIEDLELIEVSGNSYKMRQGSYDLRLQLGVPNGPAQIIETNLTLREKTTRNWRSLGDYLEELSGIH